jgi:translation initiation factor IF-3
LLQFTSKKRREFISAIRTRINEDIVAKQLRVIGSDGQQAGVMTRQDAIQLAKDEQLDLVEVSPMADPPVAKIIDWGKYKYQQTKQLQKSKKSQKQVELKQMRFGLKISQHDLLVKNKKIIDFLQDGNKVRLSVFYKGRELAHKELGNEILDSIIVSIKESIDIVIEQSPTFAGRNLSMVIRRK